MQKVKDFLNKALFQIGTFTVTVAWFGLAVLLVIAGVWGWKKYNTKKR